MFDEVLLLPCVIRIPVFNANSVNPDQTPQNAASDLGLHCLPMSLLWDARHKWINLLTVGDISKCSYFSQKWVNAYSVYRLVCVLFHSLDAMVKYGENM